MRASEAIWGGAVARLLPMYSDAVRREILDYLFLPNFGASLQVLKVEIGSDCQSTDGSEATHMRSPTDSNFSRGYEWMMMREAKARNPDIKIYGLAWGFPRWVTCLPSAPMQNCTGNVYSYPEQTAAYLVAWVAGAKAQHNITIDFIGDYNEREYSDSFIKLLRASLTQLDSTQHAVACQMRGDGMLRTTYLQIPHLRLRCTHLEATILAQTRPSMQKRRGSHCGPVRCVMTRSASKPAA